VWRSKKFIIVTVLAAVVLVGSIGGVVLAQTGNGDEDGSQLEARHAALLDRVCEIYEQNTDVAINADELQNAFAQAQSEMMEEALENRLQNLVEQGKITQEEADQYKAWQQARPDMPLPGPFEHFGGHGFPGGMKWGGGRYFWGR
jgi:hypothetical protein